MNNIPKLSERELADKTDLLFSLETLKHLGYSGQGSYPYPFMARVSARIDKLKTEILCNLDAVASEVESESK